MSLRGCLNDHCERGLIPPRGVDDGFVILFFFNVTYICSMYYYKNVLPEQKPFYFHRYNILYINWGHIMSNCEVETNGVVRVHCLGETKCDFFRTCKKKYHHTWYIKKCACGCGGTVFTPNPKLRYYSYHCRRADMKAPKNEK